MKNHFLALTWVAALLASGSAMAQSSSLFVAQSDPTVGAPMTPLPGTPSTPAQPTPAAASQATQTRAGAPAAGVATPVAQAPVGQPVVGAARPPAPPVAQASASVALPPAALPAAPASKPGTLSPAVASASIAVARTPEPRKFAVQDLITIIVRESTESDSASKLDSKKSGKHDFSVSAFPNVRLLQEFSNAFIVGGLASNPKASVSQSQDFKGDGSYNTKDTFTTRITARIVDVKPNGTLVLEARKHIKSDKESLNMVLSGTCRREDVTTDNTVLSTQLYDLALAKEHKGQVKDSSQKGWFTRVFDGLFGI